MNRVGGLLLRALIVGLFSFGGAIVSFHSANAGGWVDRPAITSWAGIYGGVHVGYGWSDADWERIKRQRRKEIPVIIHEEVFEKESDYIIRDRFRKDNQNVSHDVDGVIVGGQLGINWQRGNIVFGIEASLSGSGMEGSSSVSKRNERGRKRRYDSQVNKSYDVDIDRLFMATARLGYAKNKYLIYIKGGYANAEATASYTTQFSKGGHFEDTKGHSYSGSSEEDLDGWTIGAGVEYALTSNISFGVEYNYINLDDSAFLVEGSNQNGHGRKNRTKTYEVEVDDIHAVMARLNFRFGSHRDEEPLK